MQTEDSSSAGVQGVRGPIIPAIPIGLCRAVSTANRVGSAEEDRILSQKTQPRNLKILKIPVSQDIGQGAIPLSLLGADPTPSVTSLAKGRIRKSCFWRAPCRALIVVRVTTSELP